MDTGSLKGKVFKKKMMNENKVYGVGAVALSGYAYFNMAVLSAITGPTLPSLAVVGGLMYGMSQF